jgi:F-type H+-transporting ATPase subunit epsilon
MRLEVTTPLACLVETDDVRSLRAEDATGAFGILSGHEDFLTALAVSVVTWRNGRGAEHHLAVRGGLLTVKDGERVAIAAPEAVLGDDLHQLETEVLTQYRRQAAEERAAKADARRLYLATLRRIVRLIRPDLLHEQ